MRDCQGEPAACAAASEPTRLATMAVDPSEGGVVKKFAAGGFHRDGSSEWSDLARPRSQPANVTALRRLTVKLVGVVSGMCWPFLPGWRIRCGGRFVLRSRSRQR